MTLYKQLMNEAINYMDIQEQAAKELALWMKRKSDKCNQLAVRLSGIHQMYFAIAVTNAHRKYVNCIEKIFIKESAAIIAEFMALAQDAACGEEKVMERAAKYLGDERQRVTGLIKAFKRQRTVLMKESKPSSADLAQLADSKIDDVMIVEVLKSEVYADQEILDDISNRLEKRQEIKDFLLSASEEDVKQYLQKHTLSICSMYSSPLMVFGKSNVHNVGKMKTIVENDGVCCSLV